MPKWSYNERYGKMSISGDAIYRLSNNYMTRLESAHNADIDALEAAYRELLESHELILDALTVSDATLDKLRAAVPEDPLDFDEMYPDRDFDDLELVLRAILYPTSETPARWPSGAPFTAEDGLTGE